MSDAVLVTGGTGFVASWCIVELLRRGYTVRATLRDLAKAPKVRATVASAVDPGDRLTYCVADLTSDDGWDAACDGCAYVLHVASPLGGASRDPNALIVPAREGTLRVLRAATNAGVQRIVITSSAAAATPAPQRGEYFSDESVWTDPKDNNLDAYRKSKLLAERAAWEFMDAYSGPTTLTTILPTAIFGPVLTMENLGSVQLIQRLLDGRMPGLPRIGFCVVDVRDLADLHIRAMHSTEAGGQRFLASGDFFWMKEIADLLKANLGDRANRVPTRQLPDFVLRGLAWFAPQMRLLTPMIGRKLLFSSDKAKRLLGYSPRSSTATLIDCAESLLGSGAASR